MAFLLKPVLFEKMAAVADVQKLVKQDIRNSVGKVVLYVAAKNVKVGAVTTSIFVVTDNARPWLDLLKARRPALLVTGYAAAGEDVPEGVTRLSKPFRQTDLAARVDELLRQSPPGRPKLRAVE